MPRAVVCVSWSSDTEANRYATSLRKDLASGFDYFVNKPFPDLLPDSSVTVVGGSQHVVEWQASSPGNADLVFQMLVNISLPALPDCRVIAERMPRSLHIKLNVAKSPLAATGWLPPAGRTALRPDGLSYMRCR